MTRTRQDFNGTSDTLSRKQILDAVTKGQSLRGIDGRGVDLSGISFDNADLREAKLADANLTRCSFRNADLTDASFWSANLKDAILDGANLENADFDFANIDGLSLRGAKMKKTIWPLRGITLDEIRSAAQTGRRLRVDPHGDD